MVSNVELSRLVSRALRHDPKLLGLELDSEGWVPVEQLLAGIHEQGDEWLAVDIDSLRQMVDGAARRRHQLEGGRIRALYGHSTPDRVAQVPALPPERLFHGTTPEAWGIIASDGLKPMARQFVHLSADIDTARMIGRRRCSEPVLIEVDTIAAAKSGVVFYHANDAVWLADPVAPEFLSILNSS